MLERHAREAQERSVALRASVSDAANQGIGDPDRLERALENLVANALRHTAAGGSVELAARVDGDSMVLSVIDSGEGIAAEHLAHLFDRFYKTDASRAHAAGSGLGLSIAKAIVERHHGSIRVESRPGRTAFTVALPHDVERTAQSASANL